MKWYIIEIGKFSFFKNYDAESHSMHLSGDNIVITNKNNASVVGIFNTNHFYLTKE